MSDMSNHGSDPLGRQLALLAPTVDMAESRALFEGARGASTRSGGDGPRWWLTAAAAALIVSGIVGVWVISRDDGTPVSPADEPAAEPATDGQIIDGMVEPGAGFEVLHVAETDEPFGQAWLATDAESYNAIPTGSATAPDFARSVAVVMTRPDNACPNTLARYEVELSTDGNPVWTPAFEAQAAVCEDPLLSWIYIVAIDRDALGERADIVAPADDLYGVAEQVLSYEAAGSVPSEPVDEPVDGAIEVAVEPTGVTVPLPPVGQPAIHNTSAGLIWVVAHDDGTVSVLPATIDLTAYWDGRRPVNEVTNLASLIRVSESGHGFMSRDWFWDDHGRALTSSRSHDLTGYEGRVTGTEVAIFTSTATRIPGDAADVDVELDEYPMPDLGQPIDVPTFYTLSSSGPVWRYFDESLVVEQGVGRICDVPVDVSVDELPGCVDAEFALDTAVRHEPTFSTWYHPPILAFQDPIDGFTKVVPLGGGSTRTSRGTERIADSVPGAEWTVEMVGDGTILEIWFPGQPPLNGQLCTAEYSATVEETDDTVTIRLWADLLTDDEGQQVSCAVGDTERTVVVPLDVPIGDRTLQSADGTILTIATT